MDKRTKLDFSNYPDIPERIRAALDRYVNDRLPTGGFLRQCLENKLLAYLHADEEMQQPETFSQLLYFLYNELPSSVWGSPELVKAHLDKKESEERQNGKK